MSSCFDCENFICYRGSHDRYGVPQEPDDYECLGEPTEEEIEDYFCNGMEWDEYEDGCSAFIMRDDGYED